LQERIHEVTSALRESGLKFGAHADQLQDLEAYPFRKDPAESKVFWDVRKGLIPIVGGGREAGAPPFLLQYVGASLALLSATSEQQGCSAVPPPHGFPVVWQHDTCSTV